MFTEILVPEVMASMIPEGFPFDKLSQPKYKVKVEKDVFIEMRDGVHVAVDVYRPDAPGEFPVLYASSPYQKDLYYLPAVPTFHMRETNKIEWFVERGYVYVNHDIRGMRQVGGRPVALAQHGGALGPLRRHRVGGRAALEHRQGGDDRRVLLRLDAVDGRLAGAAAPGLHRPLRRRGRHVPRRGLSRRHPRERLPEQLAHHRDTRPLPGGPEGRGPHSGGLGPGLERHQPPDGTTTSGKTATPTSRTSSARCSASASCTRWASTCAATSAATKR